MSGEGERRPHSSRRLGDGYQDIVGVSYLFELLSRPEDARSVRFESDEFGYLDDIVVERSDSVECIQVKYAVDPGQTWSVKDLTVAAKTGGTSLIRKWASSWKALRTDGTSFRAHVITNRQPDKGLSLLFESTRDRFAASRFVGAASGSEAKALLDATGLSEADALAFIGEIEFGFGRPMLEALRTEVQQRFVTLGITNHGWLSLLDRVRRWVLYREPGDGRARAGDVRDAALLWNPWKREIAQEFAGDKKVHVWNNALFESLRPIRDSTKGTYSMLFGPPGSGKSSFLSAFAQRCAASEKDIEAVVRHHCFVGQDDQQHHRRLRSDVAARDLLRQLYSHFSLDLLRDSGTSRLRAENPSLEDLSGWLLACAHAANARGKTLVLVLDGLDHAFDEVGRQELRELLAQLPVPAPAGLYCVLGSQPRDRLLPERLTQALKLKLECKGFDRSSVQEYSTAHLGFAPRESMVDALFEVSSGNPLHLYYTLAQVPKIAPDDPEWVRSLPPCGAEIREYYGRIWATMPVEARVLAAILGELVFAFPQDELGNLLLRLKYSLPDVVDAVNSTKHLLRTEHGHVRLYHPSFQAFVTTVPGAELTRSTALRAIRDWVVDRGGELVKWSYEWEYTLRLGNPHPLLNGTTLDWVRSSLRQLRPLRRIVEILTLACETAVESRDLPLAYSRGGLLGKVGELEDLEESQTALQHLRELGVENFGASSLADIALDPGYGWSSASVCVLARHAAQRGHLDVARRAMDLIQERHARLDRVDEAQSVNLYRAAACAEIPVHRVIEHYAEGRTEESGDPSTWFAAYVQELVILRAWTALQAVSNSQDLSKEERSLALDGLCDAESPSIEGPVPAKPTKGPSSAECLSNYSALHWRLFDNGDFLEDSVPQYPTDLDKGVPWFGREGTWRRCFHETFWRTVRLDVAANQADVDDFSKRMALDSRDRARAMRALLLLGRYVGGLIRDGRADLPSLCAAIDKLGWPLHWAHDDGEFRALFDRVWIDYLRRGMVVASRAGRSVRLAFDDIELLWHSRGTLSAILQLVESAAAHAWISPDDLSRALPWLGSQVLAWHTSFHERADAFGEIARVADRVGLPEVASRFSQISVASLLGYGYHKDSTLHTMLELIELVGEKGLTPALPLVQRVIPLVEAVQDATDGDETRHLPPRLFDTIQKVAPSRAVDYLLHLGRDEEWYDLDRCLASYFEQIDLSDPVVRALGRTCSERETVRVFAERWEQWNKSDCPAPDRAIEEARRTAWFETTRWAVDAKTEAGVTTRDTLAGDSPVDGPGSAEELLEQIENGSMGRGFGRAEKAAALIAQWFETVIPGAPNQLLSRIARAWLKQAGDYRVELSDALWRTCLRHGDRESAFDLLVLAQSQGRGWTRYWSSEEKSEARQLAVIEHFRERSLQFVIASLAKTGFRYGVGEPSLVAAFLCKAEFRPLAKELAESRIQFVAELFPEYPMPLAEWASDEAPRGSILELLISRLEHPETAVRVQAARELAELEDHEGVARRLIERIDRAEHEGAVMGEWLALLLMQRTYSLPAVVGSFLERWQRDGGAIGRCLANEGLRVLGLRRGEQAPRSPQRIDEIDVPDWFSDFAKYLPVSAWLEDCLPAERRTLLMHIYVHAGALGITRKRIPALVRAERYVSANDGAFITHETKLSERLLSCYSRAIDTFSGAAIPNENARLSLAILAMPFDISFAAAAVHPRPTWVPDPQALESYPTHKVCALQLIDWDAVIGPKAGDDSSFLAGDVSVRYAAAQEHSEVLPFLYTWRGTGGADPRAVWEYASRCQCMRAGPSLTEFDHDDGEVEWHIPEDPLRIGGLAVLAVAARQKHWARRWHVLQGYFDPIELIPETPLSYGLTGPRVSGDWQYTLTGDKSPVLLGHYWQFERMGRIHGELGMSGGFLLRAKSSWMALAERRLALRWAWVRRTEIRYGGRHSGAKATRETTFHFHRLSRLVIP